jgi:hypothetical protein
MGRILVPKSMLARASRNGEDALTYKLEVAKFGPLARVPSKEKRAALAGTFTPSTGPNHQQRRAMRAKKVKVPLVYG